MLTDIEKIICLKKVSLFENLTEEELFALGKVSFEKTFKAGEAVLKENEPGHELFIVVSGEVDIRKKREGREFTLAKLGPFNAIGEMSLFDDLPHSATAVATKETNVFILPEEAVRDVVLEFPEIGLAIVKALSKKLRSADEKIGDLSKNP